MSENLPLPATELAGFLGPDWRRFYHYLTQMEPVISTQIVVGILNEPVDPEGAVILRLDPTSFSPQIPGISGGTNGREILVANISTTNEVTLLHESPLVEPQDRFRFPDQHTSPIFERAVFLIPDACVRIWYDGISERWRLIGSDAHDRRVVPP